ncbi:DUF3489 domain-containing protein [Aquisediminimonas profunda]|uniref:DUF3489 domain-containing protein n=1 Tax=Aquisediminimonas profunda TaxID=1550733 RepID=UPI001C63B4DC|nr:DUF3489 domain-containing protein [Aquisediminimonas profunda]
MTKSQNAKAAKQPVAPTQTKRDTILALLARPHGASLDEMVAATGWLPHTTRAMLTGIKKKRHALSSEKIDGVRRYRVAAEAGQ